MGPNFAIIAPGATVFTTSTGRSSASAARAEAAGMIDAVEAGFAPNGGAIYEGIAQLCDDLAGEAPGTGERPAIAALYAFFAQQGD